MLLIVLLKINNNDGVLTLICPDEACEGKLLNKLDHFCSKKGLDIKGLSKATLEKLMNWGWVESIEDIFELHRHRQEWIKKEGFGVEGTLDLHGYTEEMAYPAVFNFITSSYLAKKRCILIITGKGLPHPDEDLFAARGVLKDRVPQWLKTDELKQLILTYIHPSAKLGGSGALYILLRRNRS